MANSNAHRKWKEVTNFTDLNASERTSNGGPIPQEDTTECGYGYADHKGEAGHIEINLDIGLPPFVAKRILGCNLPSITETLEKQCLGVSDFKISLRKDCKGLTITCHGNQHDLKGIKTKVHDIIQTARSHHDPDLVHKVPYLGRESGVYISMGRGGLIKDMECKDDGRTLLVFISKSNDSVPPQRILDSYTLLRLLKERNDLVDVHKFDDVKYSGSFSTLWGRIRCRDAITSAQIIEYTKSADVGWYAKFPRKDNKGMDGAKVSLSYTIAECSSVIVTFGSFKEYGVSRSLHEVLPCPNRVKVANCWCKCWEIDDDNIEIDLTKIPTPNRMSDKIGIIKIAVQEALHLPSKSNHYTMNVIKTEVFLHVDHLLRFHKFILRVANSTDGLKKKDYSLLWPQKAGEKAYHVTAVLTIYNLDLVNAFIHNLDRYGICNTFMGYPLLVTTRFFSKVNISRLVYEATETGIEVMKNSICEMWGPHMSVETDVKQNGSASVMIEGPTISDVHSVKQVLTGIISPLQIKCLTKLNLQTIKGVFGQRYIHQLERQLYVKIVCDQAKMIINIFGPANMKEIASNKLVEFFKTCRLETFMISLSNFEVDASYFVSSLMKQFGRNLEGMIYLSGAKDLYLDMKNYDIFVWADRRCFDTIQSIVISAAENVKQHGRGMPFCYETTECVACFCSSQAAPFTLEYCGHVYCQSCLELQLSVATETKEFPLRCAQAGCNEAITWNDITKMLRHSPQQLQNLIQASVFLFVAQNKERYRLCLTAECPMIYSVSAWSESHPYQCPLCQAAMCRTCHVFSHEGLSCGQYKAQACMDHQLQAWIDEDLENRGVCPRCAEGVEKKAGCYNVHCYTCKACVCWKCKQYFSFSSDCYEHLRKMHGSLY